VFRKKKKEKKEEKVALKAAFYSYSNFLKASKSRDLQQIGQLKISH
jgi:hypothetical protein